MRTDSPSQDALRCCWGQEVAAVIELIHDPKPDQVDVQDWLTGQLAGFRVPKAVAYVSKIIRTPVGKPDYAWAREQLETRTDLRQREVS